MIANPNDDGANGANGGRQAFALWVVAWCARRGVHVRRYALFGPVRFGAVPVPPELWTRARPFDDPGDGDAAGKEGA